MKKIKAALLSLFVIFSLNSMAHADIAEEVGVALAEIKSKFQIDFTKDTEKFILNIQEMTDGNDRQKIRNVMAWLIRELAQSIINSDHYSPDCSCGCFNIVEALDPVYHYLIGKPRKQHLPIINAR